MFARCVQQMNDATSRAPHSTGETPLSNQTSSGKSAAAVIDPSDMKPEYQTTAMHTTTVASSALGTSTTKTPVAVATPLPPPFQSRNTGFACPAIAAMP